MSSATSILNISASPLLTGFYTVAHAGALVSLMFSSLAPAASTLLALVVLLSAFVNIRSQALRCTCKAIVALEMNEKGHCRLWRRDQVCIEDLQLTGGANVSLGLCLSFRNTLGHTWHLNIARDAMHSEALRSLRMRFEHALAHGSDARAGSVGIVPGLKT